MDRGSAFKPSHVLADYLMCYGLSLYPHAMVASICSSRTRIHVLSSIGAMGQKQQGAPVVKVVLQPQAGPHKADSPQRQILLPPLKQL